MINKNKKKYSKSLLPMIRGKMVEEGIRYYYSSNDVSIKEAQTYTNDYYYLRTQKFAKKTVREYAEPLNSLIVSGIRSFLFMGINKISENKPYKIKGIRENHFVYPDFKVPYIKLDGKIFLDSCLELKIISSKEFRSVSSKHQNQCYNYLKKNKKHVILLYLIYHKQPFKHNQFSKFQAFPKIFIIS